MPNESIYVVVACDGIKLKECIVLTDGDVARILYKRLKDVYGERVAMVSCRIDSVPMNVVTLALLSPQAKTDEMLRREGYDPEKVGAMGNITARAALLSVLMAKCPYRDQDGCCAHEENAMATLECRAGICPFCKALW